MSTIKGLWIIFLSSFIGIVANPEFLIASDSVALSDVDRAVNTVVIEAPAKIVESVPATTAVSVTKPVQTTVSTQAVSSPVPQTPVTPVVPVVPAVPKNKISIGGRVLDIVDVSGTNIDAGNHVNKYGDKFLYAHNAPSTFGVLYNMGEGSTFSVTYGGVTKNYVVAAKPVVYAKVDDTTLNLNGTDIDMSVVAKKARYSYVGTFDLALMTCYGTSYGNGDASHRWVLFANEI